MKSYYTIIKVVSNVLSNDSISVGLILSDEKNFIVQFSSSKVNLARNLLGVDRKLLEYFISQIRESVEKAKKSDSTSGTELFNKPQFLSSSYFSYLNKYSNNTIQYTEPKYIKDSCEEKTFNEIFKLFIDKGFDESKVEIVDKKWQRAQTNIEGKLIKRVKERVHTDIKISNSQLPNLYFNYHMDCIGLNGSFTGAKLVNFALSETTIRKDVDRYFAFMDILSRQYKKQNADNTFFLIADEPSVIKSKEHELWEKVKSLQAFKTIHSEEADIVANLIEKNQSKMFLDV